ncbi:MAG: hypothetical protein QNJ12_00490 [Ilumatobacter sp.]|uniref:hypothetical protein n=1 Tax=Ilumatobacter sp. TaxID=1967498 RepID=UPI002605795A|nr:hypothetical protein [Ilumatobacter sp.]MDJ0767229.1 hypothetical protein [Ilumatobacter sp.]
MTVPVTTEPPVPTTAPARDDGGTPTPDGPAPETAFVTTGTDLVEIDVATGTVLRVVEEFFNGDGVFRGGLRLTSDRRSAYFNEGYEDSWYGCESSKGSIGRIDLVSGDIDRVATGSWVGLSTDGTRLAYVTSDLCLPDPEQPDLWVLTPADRVVVETVGGVVQYVTASPPDSYDAPTAIDWAGFGGDDLLVLTAAGDLHRIPPDGAPVVQDNPIVGSGLAVLPVGMLGGRLLAIELGDEGSADLQLIDLVTGTVTPLASAESFMSAGISEGGHVAVVAFSDVTVVPGAPVTVVTPPPDDSYFDIDW